MPNSRYSIVRVDRAWVVCAGETRMLSLNTKRKALDAVKMANALLREGQGGDKVARPASAVDATMKTAT